MGAGGSLQARGVLEMLFEPVSLSTVLNSYATLGDGRGKTWSSCYNTFCPSEMGEGHSKQACEHKKCSSGSRWRSGPACWGAGQQLLSVAQTQNDVN